MGNITPGARSHERYSYSHHRCGQRHTALGVLVVCYFFGKNTARILPRNLPQIDSNLLKVTQEFWLTKRRAEGKARGVMSPDRSLH